MKSLSLKQPWANLIVDGKKWIETRRWKTPYRGKLLICSSKRPVIPPAGYALAIADLKDIRLMTQADVEGAYCDVYEGAYAWYFQSVWKIVEPFPVKGGLGLFEVPIPIDIELELIERRYVL